MRSCKVRRLRLVSGLRSVCGDFETCLFDWSDAFALPGFGAARRGFEDFSTTFCLRHCFGTQLANLGPEHGLRGRL